MALRLLLADDHVIFRQGVKVLLERERFEIVGEASDGREAVKLCEQHRPDIAILDYAIPMLNGVDAARAILKACPKTKAILLTMLTEDHYITEAMSAGFKACVLKSHAVDELVRAIREVARGGFYLSPSVSLAVVEAFVNKTGPSKNPLTAREREVLQLVAEGKSTKEVAAILGVSFKTAESHRSRIMQKLDIHDTATLVRYAIRRGIIQP
jgi:DNA-binding NarL/FixJ family response regulator